MPNEVVQELERFRRHMARAEVVHARASLERLRGLYPSHRTEFTNVIILELQQGKKRLENVSTRVTACHQCRTVLPGGLVCDSCLWIICPKCGRCNLECQASRERQRYFKPTPSADDGKSRSTRPDVRSIRRCSIEDSLWYILDKARQRPCLKVVVPDSEEVGIVVFQSEESAWEFQQRIGANSQGYPVRYVRPQELDSWLRGALQWAEWLL